MSLDCRLRTPLQTRVSPATGLQARGVASIPIKSTLIIAGRSPSTINGGWKVKSLEVDTTTGYPIKFEARISSDRRDCLALMQISREDQRAEAFHLSPLRQHL
ncbi:hypothetical protein NMG60_11027294 [Bertholletia excelsa]